MVSKLAFLCVSTLFVQSITAQCLPGPLLADLGFPGPGPLGCGIGVGPSPLAGLPPNMPPPGMSIYSDNLFIEGPVAVTGHMPFTGTVAVEGSFPTCGAGAVTYGCGDGVVGIVAEIGPVGAPFEYGVIDGYAFNNFPGPNLPYGPRLY